MQSLNSAQSQSVDDGSFEGGKNDEYIASMARMSRAEIEVQRARTDLQENLFKTAFEMTTPDPFSSPVYWNLIIWTQLRDANLDMSEFKIELLYKSLTFKHEPTRQYFVLNLRRNREIFTTITQNRRLVGREYSLKDYEAAVRDFIVAIPRNSPVDQMHLAENDNK